MQSPHHQEGMKEGVRPSTVAPEWALIILIAPFGGVRSSKEGSGM